MSAPKKDVASPVHWSVIEKPHPYGQSTRKLRIEVTFQDGSVRVLAPAFKTEGELHEYVDRKCPDLAGKEVPVRKDGYTTTN